MMVTTGGRRGWLEEEEEDDSGLFYQHDTSTALQRGKTMQDSSGEKRMNPICREATYSG
jgi:hypothetical protein